MVSDTSKYGYGILMSSPLSMVQYMDIWGRGKNKIVEVSAKKIGFPKSPSVEKI